MNNLKRLVRLRGDKTQQAVADDLGISRSHLANIETGRTPSLNVAVSICNYYKVPLKNLFPMVYKKYKQIFLTNCVPQVDRTKAV